MTTISIIAGLAFYAGMFLSMLAAAKASTLARSNGLDSVWAWFRHNWIPLLTRAFVSTAVLPFIIKMIPQELSSELPLPSVYALAGVASETLSSKALFILGKQFAPFGVLAPEMPQVAPPASSSEPSPPSH